MLRFSAYGIGSTQVNSKEIVVSIEREEWLDAAQRLAVGSKDRIRHAFESRNNLMIFNNPDSWSCWCFACNEGGVVRKTHPVLVEEPTPSKGSLVPLPSDCVPLQDVSEGLKAKAYGYLLVRGIHPDKALLGLSVLVSASTQRLCIQLNGGAYTGRGMAGQKVKAITYSDKPYTKYAFHPMWEGLSFKDKRIVLTEDYLSAIKVQLACPDLVVVSVQGSSCSPDLVVKLLSSREVMIMLDGDDAGRKGTVQILRRLKGLVQKVTPISTPDGKDPKNLIAKDIRRLLYGDDI